MEEKPTGAEGIQDTSEAAPEPSHFTTPPRWSEKLKLHKWRILGGVLGILVFAGAVFGAYKFGQRQVQPQPAPTPSLLPSPSPTPIFTPEATLSPTATPQPISIPEDWQEYTATDPDFGIKTTLSLPLGYSFRFTGSEFTIQNDLDATELWDYSTSVFREKDGLKNYYTGGSRRIWYQKFIEGEFWAEKPYQFVAGEITNVIEHQIGTQTYLELTVTGGPPTNYSGEVETHFIYAQNGIIHIIKPASHKANSTAAQIPNYIDIIFFSLRSTQIK